MSMSHGGTRVRRTVAVLCTVLWALATMWMAGGVAHADGTSTNDSSPGNSSPKNSAQSSASSDAGSPGSEPGKHDKPSTDPKPAAEKADKTGDKTGDKTDKADPPKARGHRKHATAQAGATTKKQAESTSDTTPAAASTSDATSDAKPAASSKAAKTVTLSTAQAVAPTALKVATAAVTPSAKASAVPNPIKQIVQFGRQMTGLANDLALIAVSLVNNLAAAAATTIGPKPFFGVPYHFAAAIAGTAATAAKLLDGTPLNAVSEGPYKVNYGVPNLLSWLNPVKPPPGANLPFTGMPDDHPLPIILLNGTSATQGVNWSIGAPVLANAGYKVYSFNYGNTTSLPGFPIQATADIRKSAAELGDEVQRVLDETGADKVILIGHSQGGGVMPAYYINQLGGDAKVSQFIGIAPSNGTDVDGLVGLKGIPVLGPAVASVIYRIIDVFGAAWTQQAVGSPLLEEAFAGGVTRSDVLYTTISSKNDWVVTPYTGQALPVGPNVTNIVLQDQYPNYNAGHLGIVFSAPTWTAVLGALAANPAANVTPSSALAA